MASKFEETKQFNKSYDELFLNSVEAINLVGFELIKVDRVSGQIEAKTNRSIRSYGENIFIKINQNSNVFIRSKSSVRTTLIDWGKNKENLRKLWSTLYLLAERQASVAVNSLEEVSTTAYTGEVKNSAMKLKEIEKTELDFPSSFPEELTVKYKCIKYIGKGGFASVYKGRRLDDKLVAVKLPSSSDAVTGKAFISELMNWTGLEHENIVRVFDFNILPVPYFEMELCECTLSEKQFPLDANSSTWIIFNICEGLKYAHSKSIIHQDLKPHNILFNEGVPKISDWGLSKVATTSGTSLMGGYTPLYAAPEHISKNFGKKDFRTDIWQVGAMFYEMITGKTPFEGDDLVAIMSGITLEDPELPSSINPDAKKLDPFIMKCLEKKQEMRYQSVSELQKELAEFLKIDYAQSLKVSLSQNDLRRSAFYCGDLFIVHLKLGDLETAYKYASDLSHYAQSEIKDLTSGFCKQLEIRIDNGMHDVPDELMKKAQIIAHKVGLGFRK